MNWSQPIDSYCERLGPGLWAEPLNLLTNLAFIGVALLAGHWLRSRRMRDPALWGLVALGFGIGIGSGLFHSIATLWAMWADIIPIAMFLFAYIGVFMRHLLGFDWTRVAAGYVGFIALNAIVIPMTNDPVFGGSHFYFGSALTLGLMALGVRRRAPSAARLYAVAWLCFILSLTLRSLDMQSCATFPLGTHFGWHLLNAMVIALVLRAALLLRLQNPRASTHG